AAFILQHKFDWLWALLLGAAIVSIQFFYWKYATGNWLIYTYGEQGFLWLNPLFEQYTFNYETGWFTYTPLMILAILGLVPFVRNGQNRLAIITMILINYYIVCSWGAWDMGGRGMVQGYALLVFPLAAFIQFLGQKRVLKWIALPIILLLTYFN